MNWKDRIEFSLMLLEEASRILADKDIIPDGKKSSDELAGHVAALKQYLEDNDMSNFDSLQQKYESVCIFKEVMEVIFPKIFMLDKQTTNIVPEYMTFDEAYEKLLSEYQECRENGSDEIFGMSINDWLEEKGIVIVDEEDRAAIEKEMMMSSSNDDFINSKTKI